jgi:hypothetical protein
MANGTRSVRAGSVVVEQRSLFQRIYPKVQLFPAMRAQLSNELVGPISAIGLAIPTVVRLFRCATMGSVQVERRACKPAGVLSRLPKKAPGQTRASRETEEHNVC